MDVASSKNFQPTNRPPTCLISPEAPLLPLLSKVPNIASAHLKANSSGTRLSHTTITAFVRVETYTLGDGETEKKQCDSPGIYM